MVIESRRRSDRILLIITLTLVALGVAMVYSASSIVAQDKFGDGYFFLKRQSLYASLGLILMLLVARLRYLWWKRLALPLVIVSLLLLAMVLVPGLGVEVSGARRWLKFAGFGLQPSELAKLALVVYLARLLVKKGDQIKGFIWGYLPILLFGGTFAGLILLEPDFGSAAMVILLAFVMLFVGGARLTHLAMTGLMALPATYLIIQTAPYRMERIMAYLDPWKDPQGVGFQMVQSYLAFGSGGITGLGLGNGRQKLFYLPEAHTDFIFSVIGEELGLIGVIAVVAAFAVIIIRGLRIAWNSSDAFGYYLALGLTSLIGFQAVINMAVVTGILPTKGLTLPFISFGGTSLILNMVSVGILLSISSRRRLGQR
ncbi:MAG: putative lipid II flippase FtsW [Thermodesulfobacteriota bacterium]